MPVVLKRASWRPWTAAARRRRRPAGGAKAAVERLGSATRTADGRVERVEISRCLRGLPADALLGARRVNVAAILGSISRDPR